MASGQPPLAEPPPASAVAAPPSSPRVTTTTAPVAAPVPEPALMKLTRGHSCVLCQQRKVRCDKQKPCANCVKAQVECRVVPPQPPRRRKKKPHERDLIDRLRRYETLMSQHGVAFEPIAYDLKGGKDGDDVADLEQDLDGLKTSPAESGELGVGDQRVDKQKWSQMMSEYRGAADDDDDDESSDEDYEGPTIHNAYDTMFDNSDGFPFVVGGATATLTSAHPPAVQIFDLWSLYVQNVDPLLKVTHTPTLQIDLIAAIGNLSKMSKPLEALLFAIYFAAITSLTEEEVQSRFGEDRAILLGRYHNATQQALINAGFMRSTELTVLQAFFLYLLCARPYVDPRSMFCLLGMAFRIAARLGLHRDGSQSDMSPFEAEQRRRLWWQIVIFDKRIAEITGSTVTALTSCAGDTRIPLNINDADLHINAKVQPGPYGGPTEMVFCLTRVELTVAASPDNIRRAVTTPGGRPLHQPMVHYSPGASSPDIVSHVANQNLPSDLVAFCAYVENVYLKPCDPKVPLHYFTLLMTRQALCKLRIIDFLCRTAAADNVDHAERDNYFMEALRMVEYDNLIQSSDMLQGFRWYTYAHFPLPAYLCLVSELRHRTTGDLCERAWNVMIENHERRGLLRRHNRNPLHIAFGRYFVKAWDAREAAERQLGRSLPVPKIVVLLRNTLARARPPPRQGPPLPPGQQPLPVPVTVPDSTTIAGMSAAMDDMNATSSAAGMYAGMTATAGNKHAHAHHHHHHHHQGAHQMQQQMGPQMMMDEGMMYTTSGGGGYEDGAQGGMYPGQGGVEQQQGEAAGGMDWNYLVQLSSLSGFSPAGGFFVQGP
ncbi:hypothetical protein C8A05DRAFT_19031 [Staphylotrichum tortipilum]|uniref:Zn(2)-C6 fungal-type domain-containing protein n=1 Tax=Staphylotrichum tortipilum TaxID=2831512 RepID=A0AAN6MDB6_9PEZI|nr:hypothetical protein C8A05DRAFT_19031 [Staphylotrichum longicolle]